MQCFTWLTLVLLPCLVDGLVCDTPALCDNSGVCFNTDLVPSGYLCQCDLPDPQPTGNEWKTVYMGSACKLNACQFGYTATASHVSFAASGSEADNIDHCKLQCEAVDCEGFVFGILSGAVQCGLLATGVDPNLQDLTAISGELTGTDFVTWYSTIRDTSIVDCSDVPMPGPPGDAGATGQQGYTGQAGDNGVPAPDGDTGDTGPPGSAGAGGIVGATGPTGLPGDKGPAGTDATDGAPGNPGTNGDNGENGEIGDTGIPGPQGFVGSDGNDGSDGSVGAPGSAGVVGPTGEVGDPGDNASNGVDGDTGNTGPTGSVGDNGPQGDRGDRGIVGPVGDTGPEGPQGPRGFDPEVENECENGLSVCHRDPLGLARCVDVEYGYQCRCDLFVEYGFRWSIIMQACEIPGTSAESVCELANAGCEQVCTPGELMQDFTCSCTEGYQLADDGKACLDVDECAGDNVCSQLCRNSYGSYVCECNHGYLLAADGISCTDIDECRKRRAGCSHLCLNDPGTYHCACANGFDLTANGHGCVSSDKVETTFVLDKDWKNGYADPESAEHLDLKKKILNEFDFCFTKYVCDVTFSPGSVVVVLIMQSDSVMEFSRTEAENIVWTVAQTVATASLGPNATAEDIAQAASPLVSVISPVSAMSLQVNNGTVWVLDDVCAQYNEEGYCVGEDSYCASVDGFPECQCPYGFAGLRCDLPGPGYNTESEFQPSLEVIQFAVLIVSIVLAIVALFVTCAALFTASSRIKEVEARKSRQQSGHQGNQYPQHLPQPPGGFMPRPVMSRQ